MDSTPENSPISPSAGTNSSSTQVANMGISTANQHSTISDAVDVEMSDSNDVEAFDARKAVDELAAPFLVNFPTFAFDQQRLNLVALKFKRAGEKNLVADIAQEEIGYFNLVLYKMLSVPMTPELKSQINAKNVLEQIKNPQLFFPGQYQKIAAALFDEFEAANWGAPPPTSSVTARAINGTNGGRSQSIGGQTVYNGPVRVFKPASDDPLWKDGGIMHHIIKEKKAAVPGQRKPSPSYHIDPDYTSKNAKVFGDNGLKIGDCWPFQLTALRDGAHGRSQGGIHGTPDLGCYSILVSGGYAGIDKDYGDTIWYSDPTAKKTDQEIIGKDNNDGKALERSLANRRPVRVIRKHGTDWKGRPSVGFRYDGLYRIMDFTERQREHAQGKFKIFFLERLEDQDPIARDRPTRAEQRDFALAGADF